MPKTDPKTEVFAVVESAEVIPFTYKNGKRAGQEGQRLKVKLAHRRPGIDRETGEEQAWTTRYRFTVFDSDNARAHQEYEALVQMCQEGRHVHFNAHLQPTTWFSDPEKGGTGEWYTWMEADQAAFDFAYDGETPPEYDPAMFVEGIVKEYELRWRKVTSDDGSEDIEPVLDLVLTKRWGKRNARGSYDFGGTDHKVSFFPYTDAEGQTLEGRDPERLHTLLGKLENEGKGAHIRLQGYVGLKKDTYNDTTDVVIRDPEMDMTFGDMAEALRLTSDAFDEEPPTETPQLAAAAADDDGW